MFIYADELKLLKKRSKKVIKREINLTNLKMSVKLIELTIVLK